MPRKTSRELTAQELIHVEAIERRILWTTDKTLFCYIRVRGQDNSLLDDTDHLNITEKLTADLSEQTEPWQIISIPRTVDVKTMLEELTALREQAQNKARLRLLDGEIEALEELAQNGAKEPLIYVKLWKRAARGADRELLERAAVLASKLTDNQIAAEIMEDNEILHLCALYGELGIWQDTDAPADIPLLPGRKRLFTRNPSPEELAHTALMEQITPVGGLFFQPTGLVVGGASCRCYGVTRYPAQIDYGWAVSLMNATDCVTCITYDPARAGEIGDALSRSIKDAERDAADERDPRKRKRLKRSASSADNLLDESDGQNKSLGQLSILVMPFADTPEDLERVCGDVRRRFSARRMTLKLLSYLQEASFRQLSPYYPPQQPVQDALQRIIPLETLVGGYPCTVGILRDDHGTYFAKTLDQKMLVLDIRHLDKDRTNGHGIVTGVSGVGKSTFLKSLLESKYMEGMRCIVIDPEREFLELCEKLGGTWLDGGGGRGIVNLLQVFLPLPQQQKEETPQDAEDATEAVPAEPAEADKGDGGTKDAATENRSSVLSTHIQHVLTVLRFKLPSLTDIQLSLLERALRELYEAFGLSLDWEFDPDRKPEEYPIMEDLWKLLSAKAGEDPRYADLALLLESMAVGADSVVWNGYTNIDLNRDLVVIDTNTLNDSSNRNRAAQYYNLLHMVFSVASADRDTPYLIIADEAQTAFDPELPAAGTMLNTIALRGRKYEIYLWMAFHSLHELLDEKVRSVGQGIVDTAAYKILFGTDAQNLADTVSMFHLTEAEAKFLSARRRKRALAMLGTQRLKVEFDIPAYKLELMGKGGGR